MLKGINCKFKLILTAIIMMIAAALLSCSVGITYAATFADSADDTPYLVKTEEKEHTSSGTLSYSSADIAGYIRFEYTVELYNGNRASREPGYNQVSFFPPNSIQNLTFGSVLLDDYSVEKHLDLAEEDVADYKSIFSGSEKSGDFYDTHYLTLTSEHAFMSYFSEYGEASTAGEYADSLNNIVFEFAAGTAEYEFLYSVLLPSSQSNCAYFSLSKSGQILREHLRRYRAMSSPPEKEGYTFTGWYYDEACTQKYNGEPITEDTNLYAGFEINKYTVTYISGYTSDDPNEAFLYDRVETVEHGQTADYVPSIEGFTFLGWYFEDGTKYENTAITGDVTLTGQWKLEEYTVTLDLDGGTTDGETVLTVERGAMLVLPVVTREGYEFSGWVDITDEILGEQPYEPGAVMSDLKLRATWKRNVFTVTFYVDSEIYDQINVEYGKTLYEVFELAGVDSQSVVGYRNENTDTDVTDFNEFKVEDDVSVYLYSAKDVEDGKSDNSNGNSKSFFAKVGNFFKKAGRVIAEYWYITVSVVTVIVLMIVVVIIIKRRR